MLSVEAVQLRSTLDPEVGVAESDEGSVGFCRSPEAWVTITSWGLLVAASREEKLMPSVDVPASTKS